MLHYYKRCKCCGKTYLYQASGHGCFEPTNDKDYCPDCKAIILEALDKQVPKEERIIPSTKEVEKFSDELLHKMIQIKDECVNNKEKYLLNVVSTSCWLWYDNIDIYKVDGIKYYIAYDNIDDIHYFIDYEYRPSLKTYETPYKYYGDSDTYMRGFNMAKKLSKINKSMVKPQAMSDPFGDLFYFDVITNFENKSEEQNE